MQAKIECFSVNQYIFFLTSACAAEQNEELKWILYHVNLQDFTI